MAYKRVNKVFVGALTAGTIAANGGWLIADAVEGNLVVEGEIIALDGNKQPITAAATLTNTPVIHIARATSRTFLEGAVWHRELEISDPIDGRLVRNYFGTAAVAVAQKVMTVDISAMTPVVGEEYAIKIVYKDLWEHPANYSHTYRVTAATADADDLLVLLVAQIQAHTRRRVNAVRTGVGTATITGINIPSNTELNAIDEFRLVEFEVFFYSDNFEASTIVLTTAGTRGFGNPGLVRDAEKHALSHKGITNRTKFPVIKPELNVLMNQASYACVSIIYDRRYVSANSQYEETTPLQVQMFFPAGQLGNRTELITVLDAWMATLPRPFAAQVGVV